MEEVDADPWGASGVGHCRAKVGGRGCGQASLDGQACSQSGVLVKIISLPLANCRLYTCSAIV